MGYYPRFRRNYIVIPLTHQLKKDCFDWNSEVEIAFKSLMQVMLIVVVLTVPNFQLPFVVKADTSSCGLGLSFL